MDSPVIVRAWEAFLIYEFKVGYLSFSLKHLIKKRDQKSFGLFPAEKILETEIGMRIDKTGCDHEVSAMIFCSKIIIIFEMAKQWFLYIKRVLNGF